MMLTHSARVQIYVGTATRPLWQLKINVTRMCHVFR